MRTSRKYFGMLAVLLLGGAAAAAPAEITLLHVNDTHSHLAPYGPKDLRLNGTLGGLTKAASVIAALKAENPSALFVHGGDLMHGDLYFNEYLGVAELQLLQSLGLDVMVLGNHEFDLGPDFLSAVLAATWPAGGNFPILSTNLDLTGYPLLASWVTTEPTLIKDVNGVRVGFFGLTTPYVINAMPAPAVLRDELGEIAAGSVQALRDQGAQVVVCLAHLGLDLATLLAEEVPGIDVIVNAHDHVALEAPLTVAGPGGGTTIIVSAGHYYRWVGRLSLVVDGSAVSVAGYELIDIDRRVPELPSVAAVVRALEAGIVARYGDVYHRGLAWALGTIPESTDPDRPERDHAIGNLWTDAYRARTRTEIAVDVDGYLDEPLPNGIVAGADVFRVNSGGLPELDPAAGTLRVPPFRLATFKLTGAQLVQALATTVLIGGDVFPQVSGMRFDYDSRRGPGQQILVETIRVNGRRLDPGRLYTLTSTEAVVMFLPLLGIEAVDPRVLPDVAYEAARDLVRERGLLLPCPQGRIRDVALLPGRRFDR
jgi:2',3'-cyclic-nucleotide 2'-phosphodiesterase (5'-nucleotidase family)